MTAVMAIRMAGIIYLAFFHRNRISSFCFPVVSGLLGWVEVLKFQGRLEA
jgi:hypothetical protein